MNAQPMFDFGAPQLSARNTIVLAPRARRSDPTTSHEAAVAVKPGNGALIEAIRHVAGLGIGIYGEPASAFDIAHWVEVDHPGRWSEASIRTAISRAGLNAVDTDGRSPRGHRCIRYRYGNA